MRARNFSRKFGRKPISLGTVCSVSVPLVVNLFDVRAFNVGPLVVRPVSVPLGVNLFDVRAFNVGLLDVRPVSDPLPRRPLGCEPLECMSVVHLQTKSLSVSCRQRAEGAHAKKVYAERAYAEGTTFLKTRVQHLRRFVRSRLRKPAPCPLSASAHHFNGTGYEKDDLRKPLDAGKGISPEYRQWHLLAVPR
jgi:hypothetical protein